MGSALHQAHTSVHRAIYCSNEPLLIFLLAELISWGSALSSPTWLLDGAGQGPFLEGKQGVSWFAAREDPAEVYGSSPSLGEMVAK